MTGLLLFLLRLERGQPLHQTALAARGVVLVQNALVRRLVQHANRLNRRLTRLFEVARLDRRVRLLGFGAGTRPPHAVPQTLLFVAANTLQSRLVISQRVFSKYPSSSD